MAECEVYRLHVFVFLLFITFLPDSVQNLNGKNLYQVVYIKFFKFTYKILSPVQFFHVNKEVFVVSQYSIQKSNNKEKIVKPTFSTIKNNRIGIGIGFSESELALHLH